ncbi:hypothetical protein DRQ36_01955 [bacterium]|nr:MAG: hypothetical protein DRQ36_01955 [bacterium]
MKTIFGNTAQDRAKVFIGAALILFSIAQTALLYDFSLEKLVLEWRFTEDSFISLRIAQNIGAGYGETFDTVNPTNGYQPLWVWFLAPFSRLFDSPGFFAKFVLVICILFFHIALVLLLYALSRIAKTPAVFAAIGIVPALLPRFELCVINGLETSLFFFLFILTVVFVAWIFREPEKRVKVGFGIIMGFFLALTFFARLDSFFLSFVIGAVVLFGFTGIRFRRKLVFLCVSAATEVALIAPYLIRNKLLYGRIMPLSGAVKLWAFRQVFPNLGNYLASDEWTGPISLLQRTISSGALIDNPKPLFTLLILFCIGSIAIAIVALKKGDFTAKVGALYAAIHLIFFVVVYRENRAYSDYYFIIEVLVFCLAVVFLITRLARKTKNAVFINRLFVALLFVGIIVQTFRENVIAPKASKFAVSRYKAALWARDCIPENELIGCFWPGTFSFVSQRKVVNLDGICNDGDFFENFIKKHRVDDYVREKSIRYIAGRFQHAAIGANGEVVFDNSAECKNWADYVKNSTMPELAPDLRLLRDFGEDYYIFYLAGTSKDNRR